MSEKSQPQPLSIGLNTGDRMSRQEFHDIYETMPDDFKAELIGGIVYVSMPLKRPHAKSHMRLSSIFDRYAAKTPGVEGCDNATIFLGKKDELQPDLCMRILPGNGGQSKTTYDNYIDGAPEFVAEVAHSSRAIDLHRKLDRYSKFGVLEYMVVCLSPKEIYWFELQESHRRVRSDKGIFRSRIFPGLWINEEALLSMDYDVSMQTIDQGLASAEHTEFVEQLKRKADLKPFE